MTQVRGATTVRGVTESQDGWHQPLRHLRAADLTGDTGQTPGCAGSRRSRERPRLAAGLDGPDPGGARTASGDHHHGDSETAIYVVSGHPVFVFAEDGEEMRLETSPGDYVFVPPFTPHREENPTDEDAVVVLARSSQEAIVVNLPGLTGS